MICSLDYIVKAIIQLKVFNALQTPAVNFKTINVDQFCCRSIFSQDVYQVSRERNKNQGSHE